MLRSMSRRPTLVIPKLTDTSKRGVWGSSLNYLVSQITSTVGLGNVWRFPFLVSSNGGGAFLLPYLLMMLLVGIPLCTLELTLGQFTSSGPGSCYHFCPLFRGVGYGMLLLRTLANTYYSVILSWSLLFFFKSLSTQLPWGACDRTWATDYCRDFLLPSNVSACNASGWLIAENGACYNTSVSPKRIMALWNETLAFDNNIHRVIPATEYLRREVLGVDKEGVDLFHLGGLRLELAGSLFVTWCILCLSVIRGLRSVIQVEYAVLIYSLVVVVVLFCMGFTLDGASDGISYYLRPELSKLLKVTVWHEALGQVIYTLTLSSATLMAMASYNVFHSDPVSHAVIIAISNAAVSFMSGFVIFTSLGFVAKKLDLHFHELVTGGNTLVFAAYPFALAQMNHAHFWTAIYFLMIFCWAVSSAIACLQTVFGAMYDLIPSIRIHRKPTRVLLCLLYFLVSLPMVTDGGMYVVNLLDKYLFIFNIFLLSLLTVVAVAWVYGLRHFLVDMEVMLGMETLCCVPWAWARYYLRACWTFFSPALVLLACVMESIQLQRPEGVDDTGHVVGLVLSLLTLLPVPLAALYTLSGHTGPALQRLRAATTPSERWGPATHKQRKVWLSVYAGKLGEHPNVSLGSLSSFRDVCSDFKLDVSETNLAPTDEIPPIRLADVYYGHGHSDVDSLRHIPFSEIMMQRPEDNEDSQCGVPFPAASRQQPPESQPASKGGVGGETREGKKTATGPQETSVDLEPGPILDAESAKPQAPVPPCEESIGSLFDLFQPDITPPRARPERDSSVDVPLITISSWHTATGLVLHDSLPDISGDQPRPDTSATG